MHDDPTNEPPTTASEKREQASMLYDRELSEFLAEAANEDQCYTTRLFRIVGKQNTRTKVTPEFLETFRDEIPDQDYIAATYGSGHFRVVVYYRKLGTKTTTSRSRDIWIGNEAIKDKNLSANVPAIAPQNDNGFGPREFFAMMQQQQNAQIAIIQALIESKQSSAPDYSAIQKTFSEMMVSSMETQQRILEMNMRRELPAGEPEEMEENNSTAAETIFNLLWQAWDKWGKQILNGGPTVQNMAKAAIKNSDEFKAIQQQPEAFADAYHQLIQKAPRDDVDKLLKICEVPTPSQLTAAAADQMAGEE